MDLFAAMYKKSNAENALPMAKYMKNQFPFLGLKKPERMKLVKPHLQEKKEREAGRLGFHSSVLCDA